MTSGTMFSSRNIAAAVVAVAMTVAFHGGWMKAMDRDAMAATGVSTVA
jgi:tellurite resistance protein